MKNKAIGPEEAMDRSPTQRVPKQQIALPIQRVPSHDLHLQSHLHEREMKQKVEWLTQDVGIRLLGPVGHSCSAGDAAVVVVAAARRRQQEERQLGWMW
jgi:hypothetical protein